jgi:hypothetical protein
VPLMRPPLMYEARSTSSHARAPHAREPLRVMHTAPLRLRVWRHCTGRHRSGPGGDVRADLGHEPVLALDEEVVDARQVVVELRRQRVRCCRQQVSYLLGCGASAGWAHALGGHTHPQGGRMRGARVGACDATTRTATTWRPTRTRPSAPLPYKPLYPAARQPYPKGGPRRAPQSVTSAQGASVGGAESAASGRRRAWTYA